MSSTAVAVLDYLERHLDAMVADLGRLVGMESPSTDKRLLDECAGFLADYAATLTGASPERIPQAAAGDHLRLALGDRAARPLLLLAHYDTVWPAGTLATMPFSVAGGLAAGPGAFDMKAGLVQALWAVRALREVGSGPPPLVILVNSDEEVGSETSRALIEAEARRAAAVLVVEPSQEGALKTARKGGGTFRLEVTGRAAHAGADPFAGVSAVEELARQVLDLHALTSRETGTTVNVGVVEGGTRENVVAAHAAAQVDVRAATAAEAARMTTVLRGLRPHHPEASLRVTGGFGRQPMERTPHVAALFDTARRLAAELGFALAETSTGGCSDGNLAAAVGAPVLDGLGAVGGGAHALTEHVVIAEMPRRAALLSALLHAHLERA